MSDNDFRDHTQGEFRGDFTRDTFYPLRHLTRVFMQQGRVQLDADWNEQVSILLHYLRSVTRDLGGEHWGPTADAGFKIGLDGKNNLTITKGHYYVQGILCENGADRTYTEQPDYPLAKKEQIDNGTYLVFLDVWERHLTYIEDDRIREVALGGPDTATRAKIVWQVKLKFISPNNDQDFKNDYQLFLNELGKEKKPGTGSLRARAKKAEESKDPCLTAPESRYRGPENQLYRVEIHKGGSADTATFRWSRDNGSVIFPIRALVSNKATLEHLGRDKRSGLKKNDWVEIVNDHIMLRGEVGQLVQIDEIDIAELTVTLKVSAGTNLPNYQENDAGHPLLRRWDQKEAEILINEGKTDNHWIELEDGIQIQFQPSGDNIQPNNYRTGDYWLIPARTATGDVEWPTESGKDSSGNTVTAPIVLPPHGVVHHYAPLAIISVVNGTISGPTDLRRKLNQLWS